MIDETRLHKIFEKQSINKDGWYIEWRREVLKSISQYSKDEMKNLIKEYEIKLDLLKNNKNISTFEITTSVLPSLGIFATLLVTLSIKISDNISILRYQRMIDACLHFLFGIILLVLFAIVATDLLCKSNSIKIVFYKELLEIFHDKLRNINVK